MTWLSRTPMAMMVRDEGKGHNFLIDKFQTYRDNLERSCDFWEGIAAEKVKDGWNQDLDEVEIQTIILQINRRSAMDYDQLSQFSQNDLRNVFQYALTHGMNLDQLHLIGSGMLDTGHHLKEQGKLEHIVWMQYGIFLEMYRAFFYMRPELCENWLNLLRDTYLLPAWRTYKTSLSEPERSRAEEDECLIVAFHRNFYNHFLSDVPEKLNVSPPANLSTYRKLAGLLDQQWYRPGVLTNEIEVREFLQQMHTEIQNPYLEYTIVFWLAGKIADVYLPGKALEVYERLAPQSVNRLSPELQRFYNINKGPLYLSINNLFPDSLAPLLAARDVLEPELQQDIVDLRARMDEETTTNLAYQTWEANTCLFQIYSTLYNRTKDPSILNSFFQNLEKVSNTLMRNQMVEGDLNLKTSLQFIQNREKNEMLHSLRSMQFRWEKKMLAAEKSAEISQSGLAEKFYGKIELKVNQYRLERLAIQERNLSNQKSLNNEIPDLAKVQQTLPDEETALIAIYPTMEMYYMLVVLKDSIHLQVLQPRDWLNECVRKFGEEIASPEIEFDRFCNLSSTLYAYLVRPIEHLIKGKKLIIARGGTLSQLPFGALIRRSAPPTFGSTYEYNHFEDLPYLIHDHSIRYIPSITWYCRQANREDQAHSVRKLAVVAPGEYNWTTSEEGVALYNQPNHAQTANLMHRDFEGERYLYESASKSNFIRALQDEDAVVYLACHAAGSKRYPSQGQIFLNQENNPDTNRNSGAILYRHELYQYQYQSPLLILNACETGMGQVVPGEGALTLGHTFVSQGVKSIVTNLWAADEYATNEILTHTLETLTGDVAVSEALHASKIAYLKRYEGPQASPFYWASLELMGSDPRICLQRRWLPPMVWLPLKYIALGLLLSFLFIAIHKIYLFRFLLLAIFEPLNPKT